MKELNKVISNQKKTIEALESANNYLHSLREVAIMTELYDMAKSRGDLKFSITVISQKMKKGHRWLYEATWIDKFNKFHRETKSSFEELEGALLGNVTDSDEDLL